MSFEALLAMIQYFGYAALFFALWLGIIGMPIPDEVIVMTGGAVTANGTLHLLPAFLLTYLGVISGLTLGYLLGRFVGTPILDKLRRKKKLEKYFVLSENLIRKYGSFALCIGYFFPILRHVMPYLVGINKMSFKHYALLSYSTGLIWTMIFFTIGHFVGDHVQEAGYMVYTYGIRALWLPFVLIIVVAIIRLSNKAKVHLRITSKEVAESDENQYSGS